MIELKDISFDYQRGNKIISLEDISLDIGEGEVILLCGESGSGKTTLTRVINGLVPNFFKGDLRGNLFFKGEPVKNMELYELSEHIGSVFQNPKSQFFNVDTTSEIAFECENLGLPPQEIFEKINKTVLDFNIEDLLDKNIFNLSGGEKQKIACASVSAPDPDVFVLDEPSSNLDIEAIENLRRIIEFWKKSGKTVIIAEHRIYYLADLMDKMVFLKKGKIDKIFNKDELSNLPPNSFFKMGLRPFNLNQINYNSPKINDFGDDFIKIDKLEFSYSKNNPILSIDSINFKKNGIYAIIGPNGAGKTTFARCLSGLQKKTKEKIYFDEKLVKGNERLKKSYMVMQDVNHQLFTESVLGEVLLASDDEDVAKAEKILKILDLYEYKDSHPMSLSGGQKQRVAIACAVASDSQVLFYDEPTSGLDLKHMHDVVVNIIDLQKMGKTQFIITHDVEFILNCCTHVISIEKGQIKEFYSIETNEKKVFDFFMKFIN